MYQSGPEKLAPLRVMLLETDSALRIVLRSVLTGFGCERVSAYSAVGPALNEIGALRPDLCVVEHELPRRSGLDFVRTLRAIPDDGLRSTPVIMLTRQPSVALIRTFVNAGVDEVLAKPVRPDAVYERIAALIRKPRPYVEAAGFFGPDRRRINEPIDVEDRRGRGMGDDGDGPIEPGMERWMS